jgi:hypothetical protein
MLSTGVLAVGVTRQQRLVAARVRRAGDLLDDDVRWAAVRRPADVGRAAVDERGRREQGDPQPVGRRRRVSDAEGRERERRDARPRARHGVPTAVGPAGS